MQSSNRCHISSFFKFSRSESHFKRRLVQSKPEFSLFWLKFNFDCVSWTIALLEISSIFVRPISQFSSRIISISIFNIRKGSFHIGYFRVFDDSNLKVIAFVYFDFPIISSIFLHDKIGIIVFVYSY